MISKLGETDLLLPQQYTILSRCTEYTVAHLDKNCSFFNFMYLIDGQNVAA